MEKLLDNYFYIINFFRCVSKNDIETKDDYDIDYHAITDLFTIGIIWFSIVLIICITYHQNTKQVFVSLNDSTLVYTEQATTFIQQICRTFQSICNPTVIFFIWIALVIILAICYYAAVTSRIYKLASIYYVLLHTISLVGFIKIVLGSIIFVCIVAIPGIFYCLPLWLITRQEEPKNKKVKQNSQKHTESSMKRANDLIDRIDYLLTH